MKGGDRELKGRERRGSVNKKQWMKRGGGEEKEEETQREEV